MMATRSRVLALLVAAFCAASALLADAVYFTVNAENHRCFLADVPAGTTFHAEYNSPDTTDVMRAVISIYEPNPQPGTSNLLAKKEPVGNKGAIPFLATTNGDHWICVSLDDSEYELPAGSSMDFMLKISMGPSAKEYQDLAKRAHMDDLHLEILKLKDRVNAIQRNQDYAKAKSMLFQSRIESNNKKAMWVSVVQICILLATGFFQAQHLRKYFHKKKLV